MPQTLCSLSSSSCVDLAEIGHVLIGPREEEEHVAGRLQIEPLEQFGALRTHAFEELHWRGELFGGRFCREGA